MYSLMRYIYTTVLWILLPWVFIRLWVRGLSFEPYRDRWAERLGKVPFPPLSKVIWVHAVSVGETMAAIPLIKRLQSVTNDPILMTTTTPTGSERVQAAFKDQLGKQIFHCYLPYDYPFALSRFFSRVKPKLGILMETELWPNLLKACELRDIPLVIANARLSPTSFKRYGWLGGLMKSMFKPIHAIAAQSPLDKKRFNHLGFPAAHIWETGNIKFDVQFPAYLQEAGHELRADLGKERAVFIAASTHELEEAIMLNAYAALKKAFPQLLLMLVPRHPDRFHKVAKLCEDRGFNVVRRSQKTPCAPETDVFLGDSMGEMPLYYAASDVVFVGGSLVPVGGHNLLEPAALGLPIISGPQTFNFNLVTELLKAEDGVIIVPNEAVLVQALADLLNDPKRRLMQGASAKKVVAQNKGALDKLMALIQQTLQIPQSTSAQVASSSR